MRHIAPFLLAVSLIALAPTVGALAAEYHVDVDAQNGGNGSEDSPFSTIQQAADVMRPGDVCLIRAGVYRETVRQQHASMGFGTGKD